MSKRTRTLWEERHHPSLIDSYRYLLTCYRHVELNPVRAKMGGEPGDYVWSSYNFNAKANAGWLRPRDGYLA